MKPERRTFYKNIIREIIKEDNSFMNALFNPDPAKFNALLNTAKQRAREIDQFKNNFLKNNNSGQL